MARDRVTFLAVVLAILGTSWFGACATDPRYAALERQVDPKLGPTTFYEEGKIAFLAVDAHAASTVRDEAPYFPLAFVLANKIGGSWRLNAEGFTLRDASGQSYPLISYEEFRKSYSHRVRSDVRLTESFYDLTNQQLGIVRGSLSSYVLQPFPFYGMGTARRDDVELGVRQYTRGLIYFPVPRGGLRGQVLELNVSSPDLENDLFVKFHVR